MPTKRPKTFPIRSAHLAAIDGVLIILVRLNMIEPGEFSYRVLTVFICVASQNSARSPAGTEGLPDSLTNTH